MLFERGRFERSEVALIWLLLIRYRIEMLHKRRGRKGMAQGSKIEWTEEAGYD